MDSKFKTIALWAGLGAGVTLSSVLLYLLLKPEEEYEVKRNKVETTKQTTVRVKVPKDVVGGVIGRQGANIKQIQEKTNTKINFDDRANNEDCDRFAVIRGTSSDVREAEELLNASIEEQSNVITETVFVPNRACGRIIGKNGESIRQMCRTSSAKILVDRSGDECDRNGLKRITISGTKEQICTAITLIDEKLAEDEAYQLKVAVSSAGRLALYRGRPLAIKSNVSSSKENKEMPYQQEELVATTQDGFIEVYISSLESPSSFWVQPVGTQSTALDKLVTDMTNFYNQEANRNSHAVTSLSVGDVLASRFFQDDSWYRARITAVEKSDYSVDETEAKVHYVDFGETGTFKAKELCTLAEEYRELPFQAVECSLGGVQPKDGTKWKEEAIDLFESLTHAAKWKVMMAKVVGRSKREDGGPGFMYQLELMDTNGSEDISVAKEMLRLGFAVPAM